MLFVCLLLPRSPVTLHTLFCRNPAEFKRVRLSSSALASGKLETLLTLAGENCRTIGDFSIACFCAEYVGCLVGVADGEWMALDFSPHTLLPTHYTLRHAEALETAPSAGESDFAISSRSSQDLCQLCESCPCSSVAES